MGLEHVAAARAYKGEPLCFEDFPYVGRVDTESESGVTDSAAAATAIATGTRVYNGVISQSNPGDSRELRTVLEYFKGKGRRTGLVTTDYMTGATPAAFGAHAASRYDIEDIADDYLNQTRPNILYGGGGITFASASNARYRVVTNRATMMALNTSAATHVSGQFGNSVLPYEYDGVGALPHLWEMTSHALAILDNEPAGFFLMVEGAKIDHASHVHDTRRMVQETLAFDKAVQATLDWATNRTDTLILVTADHENGGLVVTNDNGPGNDPGVEWVVNGHTAANVGCWAWGMGAEYVSGASRTIPVSVAANPGPMARTGTITVIASIGTSRSSVNVQVVQRGRPMLSVTPSRRSVGGSAGTTTFRVENRGGEPLYYRASESVPWLRIASGGTGNNRGTVRVACSANPSSLARTGTVTVAASGARGSPRRVKVVQAGRRKVDLVLRKLAVTRPSRAASRTFTSCRFQIYNRGPSLISGKIAVRFYLSRDRTMGNSDDRRIGDTRFVGISIRAGTKKNIVMGSSRLAQMVRFWTAGRVPRGYYYVYAKVSCTTATETRPGDNRVRTASRFPYSSAAARSAHRIEAASPAAWARSGEGDWAPAPELVDGDVDTVWTGAFPGPWAVALDYGDIIQLQDAEIQFAADPWPNVGMMGTDDLQNWFDLRSIPTWPVSCRAVYFDFRDDGSGLAPAIQEIRREEEPSPAAP